MNEPVRKPKRTRQIIRSRRLSRKPLPDSTESSNEKKPYELKYLVDFKLRGWSEREIAAYYGKNPGTIHTKLQGLWRLLDGQSIEAYQDNKVALLSAIEQEMLSLLLDTDKTKKATLGNVAYAFTQLHQARRLETNLSTANIALREIIEEIEREEASKRKQLPPQDPGSGEETAENKP